MTKSETEEICDRTGFTLPSIHNSFDESNFENTSSCSILRIYPFVMWHVHVTLLFWTLNLFLETLKGRMEQIWIKGSSDASPSSFDINVGQSRIRYITMLKLNDEFPDRLKIDWRWSHLNSESLYVGYASFRHYFKNKMILVWTTLKNSFHETRSKWLDSTSKWYILSAYKADFVKGKFKPSEDALFKDGKELRFQSWLHK